MTQKQFDIKPDGTRVKKPGWFSWRHETRDAHVAANEGRDRTTSKARRRTEAEARDAALPIDSPRRRRNRQAVSA